MRKSRNHKRGHKDPRKVEEIRFLIRGIAERGELLFCCKGTLELYKHLDWGVAKAK